MIFTVTYRDRTGAKREEAIEAADRAACVATCRARGIPPLAIRDGAPRSIPHSHNSIFSQFHNFTILVALGILSLLAILGGIWWYGIRRVPALPEDAPIKTKGMPKEVKPAKVSRTQQVTPIAVTAKTVNPSGDTTPHESNSANAPAAAKSEVPGQIPVELLDRRPIKRPFKTGVEQVISLMFTTPLGSMPFPLPRLSDEEVAKIWDILNKDVPVTEDDTEESALCKETVAVVKKEMATFLKQGATPREFLQYYQKILVDAHREYMIAREECENVREEHPEILGEFLETVNKRLQEKGIRQVKLTPLDDDNDVTRNQKTPKEEQ